MRTHALRSLFVPVVVGALALGWFLYASDQRTRQKTTQSNMRRLSTALEIYRARHGSLPPASLLVRPRSHPPASDYSHLPPRAWPPFEAAHAEALRAHLVPTYVRELPSLDSWGCPILVAISVDLSDYTLVSRGRGCQLDQSHKRTFPRQELGRDLILANGEFISFPEGDKQ